ncbi:hypothetical protein PSECIP111951_01255 [Pseudoalteromonas holothuriae]|uniref:Glycosyltransferase 2-like domain-containing protein n=1 Tax=Pseudoalteromonas holothuriae TaxID=2963714 RepID=A0ABN8UIY4_9GAMM|nr:hypothetical protein [Pseudoalteromonas sp. CIP111951]CAH9055509.1 hypothetical protein PSECIP111951_01255 [Pseudoalteromonas sp. CIP111951]
MPKRVLIAIPITDRDSPLINECFKAIQAAIEYVNNKEIYPTDFSILVMPRITDLIAIDNWSRLKQESTLSIKIECVDSYEIYARHNLAAIAKKRNFAMKKAVANNDDYVLFIDSDILLNSNSIYNLLRAADLGHDITVSAYEVVWLGYPAICTLKNGELNIVDLSDKKNNVAQPVQIVGMGCSLISKSCFSISFSDCFTNPDHEALIKSALEGKEWAESITFGEDVIFSLNCITQGKTMFYTGDIVEHKYKQL